MANKIVLQNYQLKMTIKCIPIMMIII